MLHQLVYVSVRKPICSESEIERILAASRRNNAGLDITGVLLYSPTHFFQYLEGNERLIQTLYDRIKTDPRHNNVVLIAKGPIESRLFPSWQMGAKKLDGSDIDFQTELTEDERRHFVGVLDGKNLDGSRAIRLMKKLFAKDIRREVQSAA